MKPCVNGEQGAYVRVRDDFIRAIESESDAVMLTVLTDWKRERVLFTTDPFEPSFLGRNPLNETRPRFPDQLLFSRAKI